MQSPAPQYSIADFTGAFKSLLPRGRVWPRDPDAVLAQVMAALAPTYVRQTQSLAALMADAFPVAPVELLPEWEATLGLPNPYAGTQTITQRQAQVALKFAGDGGQSVPYFLSVLNAFGFSGATITEFVPFRANCNSANQPIIGQDWANTWLITAPNLSVQYFETNVSAANESLFAITGAAALEWVIGQYAPAHTYVLFVVA
jgi:uncharacterized protein YmfQ (DUF2313 family)